MAIDNFTVQDPGDVNDSAPAYIVGVTTSATVSGAKWMAGQIVPNLTVATLSGTGSISIYNHAGNAAVVVDAFGYFSPG